MHEPLLRAEGPWLHLLTASASEADDLLTALSNTATPRVAARRVRGAKARTTRGWFDECAAAMQFPSYFGENWNAFDECITDLRWLSADAYVLLITDGGLLLDAEPPQALTGLLGALTRVGQEWGEPVAGSFPRGPKAFHVLVQCAPGDEGRLRDELDGGEVAWSPYSRV